MPAGRVILIHTIHGGLRATHTAPPRPLVKKTIFETRARGRRAPKADLEPDLAVWLRRGRGFGWRCWGGEGHRAEIGPGAPRTAVPLLEHNPAAATRDHPLPQRAAAARGGGRLDSG